MNIVIMRHGEAVMHANSDAERSLTPKGHSQAQGAGECLSQQLFCPDLCWVSPYIRAQQTKAEVEKSLGQFKTHTVDFLMPESRAEIVVEKIYAAECENLLIVSHLPLVSILVSKLVYGDSQSGPSMATSSMAYIHADDPCGGCFELKWLRHAPNFEVSF